METNSNHNSPSDPMKDLLPDVSPAHIARLIEELGLPPEPAERTADGIREWVMSTADAIEFAYRNVGVHIAMIGLGMSGVFHRSSVEEAEDMVEYFEEFAWTLGRLGWSLDPAGMLTEAVIAVLAKPVPPTEGARALFADVVSVMRAARSMYAVGWTVGGGE